MRLYFIIYILFINSCKDSASTKQEELHKDTVKHKQEKRKKALVTEVIWSTDHIKIWGDTSNAKITIEYASYKFEPYISFKDFQVSEIYRGLKADINYKSNSTATQFKTRITNKYKIDGLNFGGHYCFIWWGCGSPCQSSAIVNLVDGKVYDGPSASLGYSFKKDSKMLIVNPADSLGFYDDCVYCHPEIWIWSENKKLFEERKPM